MTDGWVLDILGAPFEQRTLDLGSDDEGPVVATVVRDAARRLAAITGPLHDVDVLYVHGWSDYFFQVEIARFWNSLGARFFALDLRKYGRSLRAHQTPGYVTSLDTYDVDIAAALDVIGHGTDAPTRRRLVLQGHSTGGLVLTLWSARYAGRAAALVLNSPWLELQLGAIGREALAPLVGVRARFDPLGAHPAVDLGFYSRAQTQIVGAADATYQPRWRPERGFPTHPGWLNAILTGQRTIATGVEVGCPALVLLSAHSTPPLAWSQTMLSTDSVLVVDDIARAATRIGRLVTIARIEGAIHDVFLSQPAPRAAAYDVVRRWMHAGS